MKNPQLLIPDFSPAHCRQAQVSTEANLVSWGITGRIHWAYQRAIQWCEKKYEALWLHKHQHALWWLTIDYKENKLSLWHRRKGLVRSWSGAHGQVLLHQASLKELLRNTKRCALEQHQVAHVLMAAAASELILRRLNKIRSNQT